MTQSEILISGDLSRSQSPDIVLRDESQATNDGNDGILTNG